MIKLFIFGLLILVSAVYLTILAKNDPGYVLISYNNGSVEMTLVLLIAGFTSIIVSVIGAFYVLYKILGLPERIVRWNSQRKLNKANRQATTGMIQLAEGKWKSAERSLSKGASNSGAPLLNYMAAARAAQQQDKPQQRDNYLAEAFKHYPEAQIAIGLTQAELEIDAAEFGQALTTLKHLHSVEPGHEHVIKMLADLYVKMEKWDELKNLLPRIKQHNTYTGDDYLKLQADVAVYELKQAAKQGDLEALHRIWGDLNRKLHQDSNMICSYSQSLIDMGEHQEAAGLLKNLLKKDFSAQALQTYARVNEEDGVSQLKFAEQLLKKYPGEATLLFSLGQICLSNQLWGKARDYLHESIEIQPDSEKWHILGHLYEVRINDPEKAMACYREGLTLCQPETQKGVEEKLALDAG